jgi:multidrug efflux system membrane fusion protein
MASPYILARIDHGAAATAAPEPTPETTAAKPFSVRVKTFSAVPRVATVSANGVTAASSRTELRARTSGVVIEQAVAQGATVKTGDVVCRLDMGTRQAQLAQAKTTLASALRDYDATSKLAKSAFATQSKLLADKAAVDAAQAAVDATATEITYLDIKSPTDGILIEKPAEAGSLLALGSLCATVAKLDPILVTVQVPEAYVPYVSEGMTAKAKLATGEQVDGKVRFVAKTADLATRTFKVELEVANPGLRIREGVTSELTVPLPPQQAIKVPTSVLILDDKGSFGVRRLSADNTTAFQPVEVIAQDRDGMWVIGLGTSADLVVLGQSYVRDGEKVTPVQETGVVE